MKKKSLFKIGFLSLFLLSGSSLFSCKKEQEISIPPGYSYSYAHSDFPYIYETIFELRTNSRWTIGDGSTSIRRGDHMRLVYNVPETQVYYCLATGTEDVIVDVFPTMDGFSDEGPILSFQGGYKITEPRYNEWDNYGCYFSILLYEGDTIYFRVKNGINYASCKNLTFAICTTPYSFAEPVQFPNKAQV